MNAKSYGHRATEFGLGNEVFSNITCIGCLDSDVEFWTSEGLTTPEQRNFLMFGLEDGRILFMDPVIKERKIFEFRVDKNPIKDMRQITSLNFLATLSNKMGMEHFQFWSLPSFDLIYEVTILAAVSHYALLDEHLMTGHANGAVQLHEMVKVDARTTRAGGIVNYEESESSEHNGPITSVDACSEKKIFLTSSADGALKIWDTSKVLLTEINLDSTLSCACFLNSQADVVFGFQNQIFIIDNKRVCPSLMVGDEEECDIPSDIESEIHEDPAVLFENVVNNNDPVNMRKYLRHFSEDVINNYVTEAEIFQMDNEDFYNHGDADLPMAPAPSELYRSCQSTPSRLSEVDLKLSAHLRRGDVKDLFAELDINNIHTGERVITQGRDFELPHFGESPGPTPGPSTPSTPRTPTSIFDVSEGGESTEIESETEEDEELSVAPLNQDEVPGDNKKKVAPVTEAKTKIQEVKEEKSKPKFEYKSRVSDIVIDAEAVLREEALRVKKTASVGKTSEPAQSVGSVSVPPSSQGSRASSATRVKKKQIEGPRKRPKAKGTIQPEPEKETSPRPEPAPVNVKPRVEKKMPLPRQRTRGFLEMESEAERERKAANNKEDRNYEFQSRRHEVDMSSVVDKLKVPSPPSTRSSTPPSTLTTQDLKFQNSPAPKKQNKMVGKKVRSKSSILELQTSKDDLTKPKQKLGRAKRVKIQSVTNLLRKSKLSEEAPVADVVQNKVVRTVDVVLPTEYPVTETYSSEDTNSALVGDADQQKYEGMRSRSVPLPEGFPPQFDPRSRTPAFLLDDDSEWNLMLDGATSKGGQDENQSRYQYSRPSTSFGGQRRPYTPADQIIRPSRPQMEHFKELFNLARGDMENNFSEELQKYLGIPGTEDHIDNLYKNDGLYFDNAWHEKAITRHILLKLQRELRAKSAVEKRKKVDAKKYQQQTTLSYHRDCSTPAPEGFGMQWKRERAQTAPLPKDTRMPLARPNTAVSVKRDGPRPESTDNAGQLPRDQLSSELPFRVRLNKSQPVFEQSPKISAEEFDLHMYDPRNAAARAFLLTPSKSIPSKCSRYILVTKENAGSALLATPLEERLIEQRFPELYDHWVLQPEMPKLTGGQYRSSTAF